LCLPLINLLGRTKPQTVPAIAALRVLVRFKKVSIFALKRGEVTSIVVEILKRNSKKSEKK